MLSLLEKGDLTSWWKLMHIKGTSKITVNKIKGENTLSARETVSQSLPSLQSQRSNIGDIGTPC